jgi:hypothetical protein
MTLICGSIWTALSVEWPITNDEWRMTKLMSLRFTIHFHLQNWRSPAFALTSLKGDFYNANSPRRLYFGAPFRCAKTSS